MTSAVMMERTTVGGHTAGMPTTWQPGTYPAGSPAGTSWSVLPRCKAKFEKCTGGFKMHCKCDDDFAKATLQNLCRMLADGMCNCCCTFNGMTVAQCNLACGHCTCEMTKDGVCITCTSGDAKCCDMLQACCECLKTCCESGCCCYVSFGSTPVCCCNC